MNFLHKIKQSKILLHIFSSTSIRKFYSKTKIRDNKKLICLTLAGLGLSSYYYLYVVPQWISASIFFENPSIEPTIPSDTSHVNSYIDMQTSSENSGSAKKDFNFIDKVVKKCAPAVFHIYITNSKTTNQQELIASPFVYGSGFVIRKDGWAITNAHVVLNKDSHISCKMSDDSVYSAQIVDIDVNIDVALLKLETDKELAALPFEEPGVVNVGEWVVALGSPLCLSNSISVGVVSSINRSAKELGLKNYSMSYIQTDALITFGNSGGPLVNLDAKVIGISSLRLTSGISFAIPIEYCLEFLKKSKEFNPKTTSDKHDDDRLTLFGLTTMSLTSQLLIELMQEQLMNVPKTVGDGLLVWKVLDGSLAKKCGLAAGDIITHIDGVPIKYAFDLYSRTKKTDSVEFVVIKNSTQEEVIVSVPLKEPDNQ